MTIRFSEAIRLGAMLAPRGTGVVSSHPDSTELCAWGAAFKAIGATVSRNREAKDIPLGLRGEHVSPGGECIAIPDEWITLVNKYQKCPAGCGDYSRISVMVAHLNDDHDWSREAIADWIATMESPVVEVTSPTVDIKVPA